MRASALALAVALAGMIALAGCGGGATPPAQPSPAPSAGRDVAAGDPQAPAQGAAPGQAPGAPLDEAECLRLADHLVDVGYTERRAAKPGDAYTAEDAETAKRELRQAMKAACPQLPRRDFTCAMAARTSAELGACQPR
jgi:hypothetical protein